MLKEFMSKLINTYIVGINSLNEIKEINGLNVINEKI